MGQHMRLSYLLHNLCTKTHADVSSRARGLKLGIGLHLHPYVEYVSSKGSGIHIGSPDPSLQVKVLQFHVLQGSNMHFRKSTNWA